MRREVIMPRRSASSLAVVAPATPRTTAPRVREGASPEVAQVFRELVASAPADHFQSGDGALLEQYAQAILLARQAYAQIEAEGPVVAGRASPWVTVLEKSHRSTVALSARLRLAPQARADARSAGRKASGPSPSFYQLEEHER